jgi:hypothetical protein
MYYILHVDGFGDYAMRHENGIRCIFVFTSKQTVSDFVELMEMPEHNEYTAISFDTASLVGFLSEIRPHTKAVAVDPHANCEFTPLAVDDFLNAIRGRN